MSGAILTRCHVYGTSVWDLKGEPAAQEGLVITGGDEAPIQVDDLEFAQFIYLLLNNPKIRDVIHTIGNKGVLILGRFTDDRKPVLEALKGNYVSGTTFR